jgi:hypothetical protein
VQGTTEIAVMEHVDNVSRHIDRQHFRVLVMSEVKCQASRSVTNRSGGSS